MGQVMISTDMEAVVVEFLLCRLSSEIVNVHTSMRCVANLVMSEKLVACHANISSVVNTNLDYDRHTSKVSLRPTNSVEDLQRTDCKRKCGANLVHCNTTFRDTTGETKHARRVIRGRSCGEDNALADPGPQFGTKITYARIQLRRPHTEARG